MQKKEAYIVSAVRTPIAAFRVIQGFSNLSPIDLGSIVAIEAVKRAGITPHIVEETITGSVLTAGHGQNVSRQIALKSDIPHARNAYTVNNSCSSGLKALILASQSIQLGYRDVTLVVGVESMSQAPFLLERAAGHYGYGDIKLVDSLRRDGISDAVLGDPMGVYSEKTAKDYRITRDDEEKFALFSFDRAANAWENGEYNAEVVPIHAKYPIVEDTTENDGAAAGMSDGAAAIVVISGDKLEQAGLKPIAKVVGYTEAGAVPVDFIAAPVAAVHELLKKYGMNKGQIALWEVNEAFAVTVLAFIKEFDLDPAKVNARGGALAFGHPIGCSGARIVVTLVHQLKPGEFGVAVICGGGGEATAMLVQGC